MTQKIKEIQTLEDLRSSFPELTKAIESEASAHVEQERLLKFAKIHFGEKAYKPFAEVVRSGVSVEQYRKLKNGMTAADTNNKNDLDMDADHTFRQGLVDAMQNN